MKAMNKTILLTVLLIAFSFCLFAQGKIKTVKMKIEDEIGFKEVFSVQKKNQSIKEGPYNKYLLQKLMCSGQYSNNKKTGEWIYYNEEKIMVKGHFQNDRRNGIWTYFRSGIKISDLFYTDANRDSAFVYYESGSI